MRFYIVFLVLVAYIGTVPAQVCEETCTTKCVETCPEKRICTKDEIDCGQGLPIPPEYCDPVRVCVSNKCQCTKLVLYILDLSLYLINITFLSSGNGF